MICPGRRSRVCTHEGEEAETEGWGPVPRSSCFAFQSLWCGGDGGGGGEKKKIICQFISFSPVKSPAAAPSSTTTRARIGPQEHLSPWAQQWDRDTELCGSQGEPAGVSHLQRSTALCGRRFYHQATLQRTRNSEPRSDLSRINGAAREPRPKVRFSHCRPEPLSFSSSAAPRFRFRESLQ